MIIPLPKSTASLRVFERVETTDTQYDIFDCGVQHADGAIDSLAVGGSFASAKRWIDKAYEQDEAVASAVAQADSDEYAIRNGLPLVNLETMEEVKVPVAA